jgi:F0F1-type ATP synthase delta subunit
VRGGKSVTEAAFEAKDLMDFSLRGSWAGYQVLADVLPFFNARVQGLYRLGRSDPKRLMMVGAFMLAATAVLALINSGEDWYERLPDWEKDGYWHVMTPAGRFKIPKPFELGVIFATIPERIARNFMGLDSNSKTIGRLWANVRDQLAFDPVPQLARPVLNVWANKDTFRERDIEGMADEGKRPHARYDARTSDTMRVLADAAAPVVDWADLGPKKLEYLVSGYFGTVGMWGLSVADAVVRAAEDKPVRPAHRLDDLPMIRAFYAEDPPKATVFESDVYKMRREVEAIVKEARALAKSQETAKAKALMKEEAPKIKAYGEVVGGAKSLTALNKQISQVYADPKMDADQKRAKVDKLLAEKAKLAQRVVKSKDVQAAF